MQPRHAALLALVAALLGVFIYVVEIRGGAKREAEAEQSQRLWPDFDPARVEWLGLTTRDGTFAELVRDAGEGSGGDADASGWRLTSPIEFPASTTAVDAILNGLGSLSREGRVDGDDLAAFGLGDDAPRVSFEADGERVTLVLGRDTPVGANRYVRRADASGIDLVRAHALRPFDERLDDLRDARVLPFDTAAIRRARFAWRDGAVTLERRDGTWWLASPVEARADAERIDTLLADLAYLRAEGFVDDAAAPGAAAFASPLFTAELSGEAEAPVEVALTVAMPADATDGRLVVRGRGGSLFAVASERLDDWPRRVAAYRDKTLSRYAVDRARTFEIAFHDAGEGAGTTRIQAEQVDGGWVAGPEAMAPGRARALVAALARLEASDVVAESLGPDERAALGLDPPRVALRVWGDGESGASAPLLADVVLGRSRPGIGVYAARAGDPVTYLLDEASAADVPTSLDAFRERFVEPVDDEAVEGAATGAAEERVDPAEGPAEPEI